MLHAQLASLRDGGVAVVAGTRFDSLGGQNAGDQLLYVKVMTQANDGQDDLYFNPDFAVAVERGKHNTHYRVNSERANRIAGNMQSFFTPSDKDMTLSGKG
jgi:hypothetical protein